MSSIMTMSAWDRLNRRIIACERCPRLREHCRHIAETKRAAFRDWVYWGKPVPNFGQPDGRLLVIGLAPAAHGANRTGRMFTGDRSGDFLYRAMFEAGFASQPVSTDANDGLRLIDAVVTAPVHCAPPANRPEPQEIEACSTWLDATVDLMLNLRGVVALGSIAFTQTLRLFERRGWMTAAHRPRPKFAHGVMARFGGSAPFILASYHPSQQNTFTGRLTQRMLTDVFRRAARQIGSR